MTFTEAAAQVLRLVGKPLHYKEITDVAIERDLLSHVGKSPEVTMGARLAALVKKNEKDNPLVRVKPGVFALREWDKETVERGLSDRTPALKMIVENGGAVGESKESSSPSRPRVDEAFADDEDEGDIDEDERERAELAANASELFEEEEDDDELILGGPDDDAGETTDASGDAGPGRRKRRRRRRGGRSGNGNGNADDLPTYTVSEAVVEPRAAAPEADEALEREGRAEDEEIQQPRARERGERHGGERHGGERQGGERQGGERQGGERQGGERQGGVALDDLDGLPLADAAAEMLASLERQGPMPIRQLLDNARRRGRLAGDMQQAQSALVAALRADNARRAAAGQRARFRFVSGRVGLTDWLLDAEMHRLERDISGLVERYREAARRSLTRRIGALPPRAIGEVSMIVLERIGLTDLAPVRRPGSQGQELCLSARSPGPVSPVQTAVVVRRDGRDVGREQVTELRGTMHHFGGAAAGLIITTGQVLSGAREEAASPFASPVRLIDGATLARLCEEHGVAVTHTTWSLPLPDPELFEALRNGGQG